MEKETFKILFVPIWSRTKKNGETPLECRVTVNGERAELGRLPITVERKIWDTRRNNAKGTSARANEINRYLETIKTKIYQIVRKIEEEDDELTAIEVEDRFKERKREHKYLFAEFEAFNIRIRTLIGTKYAKATVKRYERVLRYTREYAKKEYDIEEIALKKVNYEFLDGLYYFLQTEKGCQHNSAVKLLKGVSKITLHAFKCGWINSDPFADIDMTTKVVEKDFLYKFEVDKLIYQKLPLYLASVRDVFVFCCLTGLPYCDVLSLNNKEVFLSPDGHNWIRKPRQKTGNICHIPLLPEALQIMAKYKNTPQYKENGLILPVISNQITT